MELWVGRVPLVEGLRPTCSKQWITLFADETRLGVATKDDTVAIVVRKEFKPGGYLGTDMRTGYPFVFKVITTKNGFIVFITPDVRFPYEAKYSLVLSTENICEK